MADAKMPVELPAFIVLKTNSVEGTQALKQALRVIFTEFFTSAAHRPNMALTEVELTQLLQSLYDLIDRAFVEQTIQKAQAAGTLRPDRKP